MYPFLLQEKTNAVKSQVELSNNISSASSPSLLNQEKCKILTTIRFITNLCYKCSIHQNILCEEIPTLNLSSVTGDNATIAITGMYLLLSCTSLSLSFGVGIREWSIVAIRNAMEDNVEIQKIVAELKELGATHV